MEVIHTGPYTAPRSHQKLRGDPSAVSSLQPVTHAPAAHAKRYFKLVLMTPEGVPTAFNSNQPLPVGKTFMQGVASEAEGAVWVFDDAFEAAVHDDVAKLRARAQDVDGLAMAIVAAWNSSRMDLPKKYGYKKQFAFIRVESVTPLSETLKKHLLDVLYPPAASQGIFSTGVVKASEPPPSDHPPRAQEPGGTLAQSAGSTSASYTGRRPLITSYDSLHSQPPALAQSAGSTSASYTGRGPLITSHDSTGQAGKETCSSRVARTQRPLSASTARSNKGPTILDKLRERDRAIFDAARGAEDAGMSEEVAAAAESLLKAQQKTSSLAKEVVGMELKLKQARGI